MVPDVAKGASLTPGWSIGWDVGAWHCDRNQKSRDAIVILNESMNLTGVPWRGNVRSVIAASRDTAAWIANLFGLCGLDAPSKLAITLAIDTPLAFPDALLQLINGRQLPDVEDESAHNAYLFRRTERWLFERGIKPLSPVKDMIGSQATKGIHALAKFAPRRIGTGVWTDGKFLTAIEAYPTACKKSRRFKDRKLQIKLPKQKPAAQQDIEDALYCALVAHSFSRQPEDLAGPDDSMPAQEGWIWVPRDSLEAVAK